MSGSVNKVIDSDDIAGRYAAGRSIPQIASETGLNRSRVRTVLLAAGVRLRSRREALAIREGLGAHLKGTTKQFSPEWCRNIAAGRQAWAGQNAAGVSHKTSGYVEITRGPNKGRSQHVILMEQRLGRRLLPDEVVHHIDGDRSNNASNNLALMTRAGHTRHHRMVERLSKCQVQ